MLKNNWAVAFSGLLNQFRYIVNFNCCYYNISEYLIKVGVHVLGETILLNKKILVSGADGFIGTHLCNLLRGHGVNVIGLGRTFTESKKNLAEDHVLDITNKLKLRELVQDIQPDYVVHLAAAKIRSVKLSDYRIGYETNFIGSLNLVEACQELANFSRFIFLGSCDEYGCQSVPFEESSREAPVSAYGVTKLAVTQLLQTLARAKGFPAVILRPSVVYGPGQNVDMFLPALIQTLLSGERFKMSQGEQTRDFLYIEDLVNAIMQALISPKALGRVINISSALPLRIDGLATKIAQLIGAESEMLLDIGALDYRVGEAMNYWAKNSLAGDLLDWFPRIPIDEGLRLTINSVRATRVIN